MASFDSFESFEEYIVKRKILIVFRVYLYNQSTVENILTEVKKKTAVDCRRFVTKTSKQRMA